LPARGGAWTQPGGKLWVKTALIYQFADQFYAQREATLPDGTRIDPGDVRPYDDEGASRQRLLWLEAEYGLSDRLTLGLQLPWVDLHYEDRFQTSRSWGPDDLIAVVRWGVFAQGRQRWTLRSAVKLPTGRTVEDPDRIPISENQVDWELGAQFGQSLGRALSWIGVEGGYRLRFEDESRNFDPGNEWFWRVEAGWGFGRRGRWGVKLDWVGVRGDAEGLDFFAPGSELSRDLDLLDGVLMVQLGRLFVEGGVGYVLGNHSHPAAPIWSIALSTRFHAGTAF
jgi:hypothetical protein